MRFLTALVTAAGLGAGFGGNPATAQSPDSASGAGVTPAPLDVPYLSQSVLLCGGAAVAMVERWWGRRGVYAADFAGLVRPALGGIRTTDLAAAVKARGWRTEVLLRASPSLVQQSLRERIPVVALIRVGRARYHFIVLLGWSGGRVVYHDPAGTPFTSTDEAGFLDRWDGADRWALVIQPAPVSVDPGPPAAAPAPAPAEPAPCPPWLDRALDAAAANRLDAAEGLLEEARRSCPDEPVLLRELAAVRFKQGRPSDAVPPAAQYTTLVPGDELGWQLLATSRYLSGDPSGALAAWNRTGRPTVDLIRVDGARQIRFGIVERAVSIHPGRTLTPGTLGRARRRVADLPAVSRSAVTYQPVPGGLAEIRATIVERPVLHRPAVLAAGAAIRALTRHEVGLEVGTPTGGGELVAAGWRWEGARPRALFRAELPVVLGIPGVVAVEGAWEQFRFAAAPGIGAIRTESRHLAGLGFGGWISSAVRPAAAIRLDRWSDDRTYLPLGGGAEVRVAKDRLGVAVAGEWAVSLSGRRSYPAGSLRADWVSTAALDRPSWSVRAGFDWVGAGAPLGTWPVVGGNVPWAIPLRGHPATSDGLLSAGSVARRIGSAGVAADHPILHLGPAVLAAGLFLDAAAVGRADGPVESHRYLDGGGGLRLGLGGGGGLGVLQIDVATGLVDRGRTVLTIGLRRDRRAGRPASW